MARWRVIIISVVVVFAVAASGFWAWRMFSGYQQNLSNENGGNNSNRVSTNGIVPISGSGTSADGKTPAEIPLDPVAAERARAKQLATNFVERYGSYSTDSNYANIEDVLLFMTPTYRVTADAEIAAGRKKTASQPQASYFGVVTKVLNAKENGYDATAGTASYEVTTQRRRTDVSGTKVSIQLIIISLLRIDGQWRVNSAMWK